MKIIRYSFSKKIIVIFALLLNLNISEAQKLVLVKDLNTSGLTNSFPHSLTAYNNLLYVVASNGTSYKLYSTDGTNAGTMLIGPSAGNGIIYYLTAYNGKLFFTYDDGKNGLELWTSDGTPGGTKMLKDIWIGSNSSLPMYFTICNGLLFFQASTAARSQGLWVTDGTEAGTVMLANLYAAPFNGTNRFISYSNKIYFQGNSGSGYYLWESDGTTPGTQSVKSGTFGSAPGDFAICNGKIYFTHSDNVKGSELWVSDGTDLGTKLVKDINKGIQGSDPDDFITLDNQLYFIAKDSAHGQELWTSDGTEGGTKLVKDITPGINGSAPQRIMEFKGEVYFFAYNGTSRQLYKTNKTMQDVTLIKSLQNITGVPYAYNFNDKLYFLCTIGGSAGGTVYESDGTTAGTVQITPVVQSEDFNAMNFAAFNNELYLPALYESQGLELCKLTFGTVGVRDVSPASNDFRVYPNPVGEEVNLLLNLRESTNLTLYLTDLLGNTVLEISQATYFPEGSSKYSFHLPSAVAAGSYLLYVESATEHTCLKLMKE